MGTITALRWAGHPSVGGDQLYCATCFAWVSFPTSPLIKIIIIVTIISTMSIFTLFQLNCSYFNPQVTFPPSSPHHLTGVSREQTAVSFLVAS